MTGAREGGIAVVIVDWNSGELIDRCLKSLARQTLLPQRTIVVDNASSPQTRVSADLPGLGLVRLPENRGFAAGCNHGIALAAGVEWVALLNPDAFPEPDWLEALLAAADRNPRYSFFASRQVMAEDPGRLDGTGDSYAVSGLAWRRDYGQTAAGRREASDEVFGPCAAAALYRHSALVEAGGLDDRFFCYFEDVDLAFRLRLLGHRCLYVPGAVVQHVGSGVSGRRSEFTIYHGHRNLVWTFWKNMPARLLVRYWPHHLVLNLVSLFHLSREGRARPILRAKGDALRGMGRVLRQRRVVQASRTASAGELRQVMSAGLLSFGVGMDDGR